MRALLIRLHDRRDVLKDILEHAVPTTLQDVVIIFVTVSGHKKGLLVQETYANKIYSRGVDGRILSSNHDGYSDLYGPRSPCDRPTVAERVRPLGGHIIEGFLRKPSR
jgi:hypothetical protein